MSTEQPTLAAEPNPAPVAVAVPTTAEVTTPSSPDAGGAGARLSRDEKIDAIAAKFDAKSSPGDDVAAKTPPGEEVAKPAVEAKAPDQAATARAEYIEGRRKHRETSARLVEAEAKAKRADELLAAAARYKDDPHAIIRAAGLEPNEYLKTLAENALRGGGPTAEQQAIEMAQREEQEARERITSYAQELDNDRAARMVAQEVGTTVLPLVTADRFAALYASDEVGGDPNRAALFVFNVAKEHYQKTGQAVPYEEVASRLEAHFDRIAEARVARYANVPKFKQRFAPASIATMPPPASALPPEYQQPSTLTNRDHAGLGAGQAAPLRRGRSREEQIEAIAARFDKT